MTSPAALSTAPRTAAFPRALVRLLARSQRELLGLRLSRLYGLGIGVSYGLVTLALAPEPRLVVGLWVRCLATASWVAGVGALSLARDLRQRDAAQGLAGLARLRGFGESVLERARTLAGMLRLTSAVALPGLLVAASALARLHTLRGALLALVLALFTLPYAALLGSTLALLARLSSRLLPERGRLLFCGIVLLPWLLARGTHSALPNIPDAFGWLLAHVAGGLQ